mgnify:CR=1 FL=1
MDFDFGTSEPAKEEHNDNEINTSEPPQQNNDGFMNMDFLTNPPQSQQPQTTLDNIMDMNFQPSPQSQNTGMNLNNLNESFNSGSFDAIVCNPPYKKSSDGLKNSADAKTIARHEILCSLEDVIRISCYLLKSNGSLYMVHRPERLCDIIELMRKYKLEPKQIRFIQPKLNSPANLVLIKAVKGGKPFLKLMENLIVYKDDGNYTDEFLKIYNMI